LAWHPQTRLIRTCRKQPPSLLFPIRGFEKRRDTAYQSRSNSFGMNVSRWPRLWLGLVALLLVVVAFVAFQLLKAEHDPRIESLRSKGYPITVAELDDWYPAPLANQNAALLYTNAFAQPAFTMESERSGQFVPIVKATCPIGRSEELAADLIWQRTKHAFGN
jgi:hypothetical protein